MTKYLEKDLEYWDKITRKNSKNLYAWEKKGWALGGLGRYEEALECFDKALEIEPKHVYAWFKKGWALGGLGRYEEALKCYDKALEINPKNANVLSAKNSVKRKIENRKREEM